MTRSAKGALRRRLAGLSGGIACALVMGALPATAPAQGQTRPKVIQLPIRSDGPKSLDPVKGSTVYDNQGCAQIYDTLLQQKYLVRPAQLEPLLLEEMPKVTDNADGTQVWAFKLRKDVRFQDDACFAGGRGRQVVTDDVFYSWKRMADPEYEYESWWLLRDTIVGFDEYKDAQKASVDAGRRFDYDAPVAGMRKKGDHEFEIVLKKPVTRLRWVLTMFQTSIVPREAVERYGSTFGVHPVGTGPFMVRDGDWRPGEYLYYTRNPTYRTELYPSEHMPEDESRGLHLAAGTRLPIVDRIEITFYVPDPPLWLDFQSGKIGYTQVPSEYFKQAFIVRTQKLREEYAKKGIAAHPEPLLDFIFRGFNMEDPVVGGYDAKRRALRKAICLALDLDEVNETFYNGTCIVYDGPIPPQLDGFPKDGNAPVSNRGLDLRRAKELLAEAGFPDGKGLPVIDYYVSRGGNEAEQSQMLVRQLEKIGVKVNPKLVDFSDLIDAVNRKKATFFGFAWGTDYPDAENNLALFYSPNVAPGANHYNYKNAEYDKLYERIRVMPPGPERTKIYEQMRDIVIEDAPFSGSLARTRYYLINPWLKNFKPSEDFYNWMKYLDVDESKR